MPAAARAARGYLLTKQPAQSPAAMAQAVVRRGSAPNPARRGHLRGERQGHRSALPLHPLLAGSSFATPPAPPGVSDGSGHRSALPQDPLLPEEVVPHSSPKPPAARAPTRGREGGPSQRSPHVRHNGRIAVIRCTLHEGPLCVGRGTPKATVSDRWKFHLAFRR